jgi:hypothetical protein
MHRTTSTHGALLPASRLWAQVSGFCACDCDDIVCPIRRSRYWHGRPRIWSNRQYKPSGRKDRDGQRRWPRDGHGSGNELKSGSVLIDPTQTVRGQQQNDRWLNARRAREELGPVGANRNASIRCRLDVATSRWRKHGRASVGCRGRLHVNREVCDEALEIATS